MYRTILLCAERFQKDHVAFLRAVHAKLLAAYGIEFREFGGSTRPRFLSCLLLFVLSCLTNRRFSAEFQAEKMAPCRFGSRRKPGRMMRMTRKDAGDALSSLLIRLDRGAFDGKPDLPEREEREKSEPHACGAITQSSYQLLLAPFKKHATFLRFCF